MYEPTLFDPEIHARATDPGTSAMGAAHAALRAGTHKALLLHVFADGRHLTDEEAAEEAGLARTGFWKRCSDLRNDGLIEPIGTRVGNAGTPVMVCQITAVGLRAVRGAA